MKINFKNQIRSSHRLFIKVVGIFVFLNQILLAQSSKSGGLPDPASEPIVRVVQKTLPTVVNINTEKTVIRALQDPLEEEFNRFFGGPLFGRRLAMTVRSLGSGFLIDEEGYILTNEHVVERAADLKIKISLFNGKTYDGRYIYGDRDRDLALIKIVGEEKEKFPFVDINNLSSNYIGQTVVALGNPVGYQSSVSAGILSGKGRTVGRISGLLQTDAPINPGNSGGPLMDIAGKLVGVASLKLSFNERTQTENISFAIPGEIVSEWTRNAIGIAKGTIKPPEPIDPAKVLKDRFGIQLQDLSPDLAQALGFRLINGVVITSVEPDSPAAKAGITDGLVLQMVNNYATPAIGSLPPEIASIRPGDKTRLILVRALKQGNVLVQDTLQVVLTAR